MTVLVPSKTGYSSVDDFPPLTDEQCARIAALLSLTFAKPEGIQS